MRTFANFLYIGNLYQEVPKEIPEIRNMYYRVFRPVVTIVEEDCGTKLGTTEAITPLKITNLDECASVSNATNSLLGKIDLKANSLPISPSMITNYQLSGVTSVKIRSASSCTSTGGICRRCLWSSYEYLYPEFERSTKTSLVTYPDFYASSVDARTPILIPPVGGKVRVDFTQLTTPFLSYISRSYSGSLIGMKSYINDRLPLREGLYEKTIIKEPTVPVFMRAIIDSGVVSPIEIEYAKTITSSLEKVLYLLAVYTMGFYANA